MSKIFELACALLGLHATLENYGYKDADISFRDFDNQYTDNTYVVVVKYADKILIEREIKASSTKSTCDAALKLTGEILNGVK